MVEDEVVEDEVVEDEVVDLEVVGHRVEMVSKMGLKLVIGEVSILFAQIENCLEIMITQKNLNMRGIPVLHNVP